MNGNRKYILMGTLCILLGSATLSVKADVGGDVARLAEQLRSKQFINNDFIKKAPSRALLTELWKYLNDPSERVRVSFLETALGMSQRDDVNMALRQEAVELLLTGLDKEPLPALASNIGERMQQLPRSVFSRKAKDMLARMMSRDEVLPEIVQLVGVANVQTSPVRQRLKQMSESSTSDDAVSKAADAKLSVRALRRERGNRRANRAARWALGRLGNIEVVEELIARLDAAPDAVARLRPMQDLARTRQPEAVAALVRYLFSEERLPNTMNDNFPGPKLATFAVSFLKDIVEGFPEGLSDSSDASVEKARQWVTQQGVENLRIKD